MALTIPPGDFAGYIFDCDGTLADNMPLHFQAWTMAMREVGGTFPEDLFYAWGGRPTAVLIAGLNERFGLAMDPDTTGALKERLYLGLIPQVRPVQAVVDIANAVHGTAPMAVASGGQRQFVEATLGALGILGLFDAIVCVEDYARGKPAPDPLLVAADRIGILPTTCVVFDDSDDGIEAAKAAGMAWVRVPASRVTRSPAPGAPQSPT